MTSSVKIIFPLLLLGVILLLTAIYYSTNDPVVSNFFMYITLHIIVYCVDEISGKRYSFCKNASIKEEIN